MARLGHIGLATHTFNSHHHLSYSDGSAISPPRLPIQTPDFHTASSFLISGPKRIREDIAIDIGKIYRDQGRYKLIVNIS